ncbi:DMT family transporter [Schinkia azotoformans]|uniref:DMT family transporter n=1 Tax=Schinkia azotoformans TaxID=1454 RepID=UPI002DBC5C5B|nr:DMT family transporter [Schinkia azotoformans]MEC1716101.1 DMT family transporter [Schinkia azotoformans]MEC1756140.1 DMT family transporter [Schinkia azotoformans]
MKQLRGMSLIIAAATLFGFMPIWTKQAYATGLSISEISFLRFGLAAVMIRIAIHYRRIDSHVRKQQIRPLFLSIFIGYIATNLTLSLSYKYISSGIATSLHYLFPVIIMLLAYFIYHEKLNCYKWMALVISLTGIYLVASPGGSNFSLRGVTLAISSAIFFVIYVLLINHHQLKKMDSLVLAFYSCLISSLVFLIFILMRGNWSMMLPITLKGFFYVTLLSSFCSSMAMIFFIKGVQSIGSINASILSTFEPVVSLVAGIFILDEPLSWQTSMGCIMIISAVILIGYSNLAKDYVTREKANK